MLSTAPLSAAHNRLWLPRTSLTACTRGVIARNTLGVELTEQQRFNYFPASPLCSISWWFEGRSELFSPESFLQLAGEAGQRTPLSGMLFSGPHTRPTVSWNPGPVHGMMWMLMPDAVHQLTGIDIAQTVNRFIDVRELFPGPWVDMCDAVMSASDDSQRVTLMENFLEPLWQAARPKRPLNAQRYQDWAHALALRAATSGAGRSLRQVERRIKQWTGQPLRELRGVGRSERAFFEGLAFAEQGERPNWAAVAESSGYADQSHLCRETRRITGFTPEELYRRIASDEGFWVYRLWA
jgi:AraC-like DNA-binding protein